MSRHGIRKAITGHINTRRWLSRLLHIPSLLASIAVVTLMTLYLGFDHNVIEFQLIHPWLEACRALFIANILLNLSLRSRPLKWIVDSAVLLSLLPLHTHALLFIGPGIYAITYLCQASLQALNRHTNPSLILSASFLLFITVGTLLLLMPKCTLNGIAPVDALFTATSAVCICGLTSVDIPSTFTPLGLTILALLMQVGALGVMTFTTSFALFFSGNAPIYSQMMLKDILYSRTINSLLSSLLYTLAITLTIELLGTIALYATLPPAPFHVKLGTAAFHSISAFCNAGFSSIPGGLANPQLLYGNQLLYIALTVLIMLGGLGFPILLNAKDAFLHRLSRRQHRPPHLLNTNTRVALVTSTILGLITLTAILLLEWNGSLAHLSTPQKLTQALFNAATPRSAGFVSINPLLFTPATLLIVMFMMWVGASSQSTAGGIKVNTFAAAMLHLRAAINGSERVRIYNRTLSAPSLSRAQAVVWLSLLSYAVIAIALCLLCPQFPTKQLLFEALSALFTVGSTLGITTQLPPAALLLLSLAMFIGRVGLLSILMGLAGRKPTPPLATPQDDLIIT